MLGKNLMRISSRNHVSFRVRDSQTLHLQILRLSTLTSVIAAAIGAVLWVAWCLLVLERLVPAVLRHLTIYSQLVAFVLCMLPPTIVITAIALRARRS
jgi:magnesium-transporting ATPase (P-type)